MSGQNRHQARGAGVRNIAAVEGFASVCVVLSCVVPRVLKRQSKRRPLGLSRPLSTAQFRRDVHQSFWPSSPRLLPSPTPPISCLHGVCRQSSRRAKVSTFEPHWQEVQIGDERRAKQAGWRRIAPSISRAAGSETYDLPARRSWRAKRKRKFQLEAEDRGRP